MTELPVTVSQTSTVVSLLSKKPKKSCLSKPRICSIYQSPSTPTESTMVSEEVSPIVSSSTSQQQSFGEVPSTVVPAVKEIREAGNPIILCRFCSVHWLEMVINCAERGGGNIIVLAPDPSTVYVTVQMDYFRTGVWKLL